MSTPKLTALHPEPRQTPLQQLIPYLSLTSNPTTSADPPTIQPPRPLRLHFPSNLPSFLATEPCGSPVTLASSPHSLAPPAHPSRALPLMPSSHLRHLHHATPPTEVRQQVVTDHALRFCSCRLSKHRSSLPPSANRTMCSISRSPTFNAKPSVRASKEARSSADSTRSFAASRLN